MMGKKKPSSEIRRCADCMNESVCLMWSDGRPMSPENAPKCPNYETIRDSAAYLVGKLEAVRHGRWVQDYDLNQGMEDWSEEPFVRCSECEHKEYGLDLNDYSTFEDCPNYCPNCGAKMDAEVEHGT